MSSKMVKTLSGLLAVIMVAGCATTITTRMVTQTVPIDEDSKAIFDVITFVLTNNGFDIAMVNETYGLCNTNWRPVKSGADTAASVLSGAAALASAFAGSGSTSFSTYSREMMISVQLVENGYKVIPKLKRITSQKSVFATTESADISYPTQNSGEGKLVNKLIEEINGLLKISNNYVWEEKEVSIENHEY